MAKAIKNFKSIEIEDIIAWCQEHGEVAWLKEVAARKTACKVYPRMKVEKKDKDGNTIYNDNGKPVIVSMADKSKKPKTEMRPISFFQIKQEFCAKFFPELLPKKQDAPKTMHEIIAAL